MKTRLHFVAAFTLLLIAAVAVVLSVRSFWVSDWVLLIHRLGPGRVTAIGAATWSGSFAAHVNGPNGSDYGDRRNTLFQFNPQPVGSVMIYPFRASEPRRLGFGWYANGRQRYVQIVVPAWFVVLIFAATGAVALHRARRLHAALRAGLCARCGYDLRGTPDRCPECGTPAPSSPRSHQTPDGSPSARLPSA